MCISRRLLFSMVSFFGISAFPAYAGKSIRLFPTHPVGVRPAGMGDAFTAVADDQNALYYNPAGLAKLQGFGLELINPLVGINKGDFDSYKELDGVDVSKAFTDSKEFEKFRPIIGKINGRNHYVRFGLNPSFVMRNFGFAALLDIEAGLMIHNPADNMGVLSTEINGDTRFGGAYKFFGDKLSVGAAVAYKNRGTVYLPIAIAEIETITNDYKNYAKEKLKLGQGFGFDVGALFTPVETWTPTLGVAILNVGDTKFTQASYVKDISNNAPSAIPQVINIGMSVTPTFNLGLWTRGTVEFKDINLPTMAEQKPRFGLEAGWRNFNNWINARGSVGWAEGSWTAGASIRLFILDLRYSTYNTEQGFYSMQKPERRHLIQLSFKI